MGNCSSSTAKKIVSPQATPPTAPPQQTNVTNNTPDSSNSTENAVTTLTLGKKIGQGGASEVFSAQYNDQDVAYKRYRWQLKSYYKNEKTIHYKLNHPHIVKLLGHIDTPDEIGLIMVLAVNGTLQKELDNHSGQDRNPVTYRTIALGIAQGMKYIHSQRIIYRDLKAENILLGENMNAMICDFSGAQIIPQGNLTYRPDFTGSLLWSPPEMGSYARQSVEGALKFDSYCFGWLLYVMASYDQSEPPDENKYNKAYVTSNDEINIPCMNSLTPSATNTLMLKCWQATPEHRPSFEQISNELEATQEVFKYEA